MRVLILVPGLPLNLNNIKGGVHSAVSNLLKGFAKFDIDVRVLSFSREVENDICTAITEKIEICYSNEGPYPYHLMNYLLKGPSIVKRHIRDFAPDVIHYQEGNSFMLTRIRGLDNKTYLQTIHGMALSEAKRKKTFKDKMTWYINGLLQISLLPRNVIHLSKFSHKMLSDRKITHSAIIPNAIIPQYFSLPQKQATTNSLLYIGVIDNNKNLMFLLHCLKELVENNKLYKLDILGDFLGGLYKQEVSSYIAEQNLAPYITFNGWVPQSAVLEFIQKTDILVVSSKHESLPMVIAESMAAGKIVVASAVGGIPEMIEHDKTGFLFNLGSTDGLVNILNDLYDNNEKLNTISKRAKETAMEKYQCDNVAKKTIEFYKQCMSKTVPTLKTYSHYQVG